MHTKKNTCTTIISTAMITLMFTDTHGTVIKYSVDCMFVSCVCVPLSCSAYSSIIQNLTDQGRSQQFLSGQANLATFYVLGSLVVIKDDFFAVIYQKIIQECFWVLKFTKKWSWRKINNLKRPRGHAGA